MGPITSFTQVVTPDSSAVSRNFHWVSGTTCSPSTLGSFTSMLT